MNNTESESDYIPSTSDNDTTSTSDTPNDSASDSDGISDISSVSSVVYDQTLSEDDIADITLDIYNQIDDIFATKMINMSSPKFYSQIIEEIAETLFIEWENANICDEEDEADILIFVKQVFDTYIDFSGITKRSVSSETDCVTDIVDVPSIMAKITALQNIPQPKQRTKEWYEFRNGLITASNIWKAFGSESQVNSLIYEKCKPIDMLNNSDMGGCNTESPLHWGVKYEPVTLMVYEASYQTKVGEFGCIQHPKYPYIGASPDGINIDPTNKLFGRMLEIKNIINREITGIPKEEYWIQTQIQMETCDLDSCDFVETRFLEYSDENQFYADVEKEYRGVILHFIERTLTSSNSKPVYRYMPLDILLDSDSVQTWVKKMKETSKSEGLVLFTTIYWYLDQYSCVLINRNKQWFETANHKIADVWKIIEKEREEGYEHRASKKRVPKITVNRNNDDYSVMTNDMSVNSYVVQNMPAANRICLVKLDF